MCSRRQVVNYMQHMLQEAWRGGGVGFRVKKKQTYCSVQRIYCSKLYTKCGPSKLTGPCVDLCPDGQALPSTYQSV